METGREEMDNFLLRACNALDKYKGFASTQGGTQDVSLTSWPWRVGRDQHGGSQQNKSVEFVLLRRFAR
jgi:hypothetical protein